MLLVCVLFPSAARGVVFTSAVALKYNIYESMKMLVLSSYVYLDGDPSSRIANISVIIGVNTIPSDCVVPKL